MERFYIDNYLYNLAKDIKLNKEINASNLNFNNSNITVNDLRNELVFFNSLNLPLPNVFVRYRGQVSFISPRNIKIYLGESYSKFKNSHLCQKVISYGPNIDFIDLINEYIFINTYRTYPAKSAYLHEITHSLITEYKNVLENINKELLPIYIELLYGYYNHIDLLFEKLKSLSIYVDLYMMTVSEEERIKTSKYISSILKATNLFYLYLSNKQEITKDVSKVFNYDMTLEDVLNKYDIDLDNFKPSLNKLIKIGKY